MVPHFHNLKSKDHFSIWRSKAPNVSLVEGYQVKPVPSGLAFGARQTGFSPETSAQAPGNHIWAAAADVHSSPGLGFVSMTGTCSLENQKGQL